MTLKQKIILFAIKYLGYQSAPDTKLLRHLLTDFGEIIFIAGSSGKTSTKELLEFVYKQNNINTLGANFRVNLNNLWKLATKNTGSKYEKLILELSFEELLNISEFIRPNKLILTNISNDDSNYAKNCILVEKSLKNMGFVEINSETSLIVTGQKSKKIRRKNKYIETPIVIIPPKLGESVFSLKGEVIGEYSSDQIITAEIAQAEIDKENQDLKNKSIQDRIDMSNWFKSRKAFEEDKNNLQKKEKKKVQLVRNLDPELPMTFRPEIYVNSDDLGLLFAISTLDVQPIGFGLDIDEDLKPDFVEIENLKSIYLKENFEGSHILSQDYNSGSSFTVKIDKRREYLLEYNLPSTYFAYNALAVFLVSYKDLGMRNLKPIKEFVSKTYKKLSYKGQPFLILKTNNSFGLKENLQMTKTNFDKSLVILGLDEAKWIWKVGLDQFLADYSLVNNKSLGNKSIVNITKKQLEIFGFGKKSSEILKWLKTSHAPVDLEHIIGNITQIGGKIDAKNMPIVFCGDENCISLLLEFMGKKEN